MTDRKRSSHRCIVFHGDGSKTPVFWVNPGYQQLAAINHIGPDQPIYCLYRDKPDPRQAPLTFREIAAFHIETMREVAADGPYPIVGYCVYGAIAFQMACQLRELGLAAAPLIMIDPTDPALSRLNALPQPLASQLVFQFHRARFHLEKIQNFSGKERVSYLAESVKRVRKSVEELARARLLQKNGWPVSGEAVPPYLLEVHQADIFALRLHSLPRYPGSAIVLRPRAVPKGAHDYGDRRWKQLIGGRLDIEKVSGDSDSMWSNPDLEPLCQRILYHLQNNEVAANPTTAPIDSSALAVNN